MPPLAWAVLAVVAFLALRGRSNVPSAELGYSTRPLPLSLIGSSEFAGEGFAPAPTAAKAPTSAGAGVGLGSVLPLAQKFLGRTALAPTVSTATGAADAFSPDYAPPGVVDAPEAGAPGLDTLAPEADLGPTAGAATADAGAADLSGIADAGAVSTGAAPIATTGLTAAAAGEFVAGPLVAEAVAQEFGAIVHSVFPTLGTGDPQANAFARSWLAAYDAYLRAHGVDPNNVTAGDPSGTIEAAAHTYANQQVPQAVGTPDSTAVTSSPSASDFEHGN